MDKLTLVNLTCLIIGTCFLLYIYKEEINEYIAVLKFCTLIVVMALFWAIMLGSRECYVVYEKDVGDETQIRKITFPSIT